MEKGWDGWVVALFDEIRDGVVILGVLNEVSALIEGGPCQLYRGYSSSNSVSGL